MFCLRIICKLLFSLYVSEFSEIALQLQWNALKNTCHLCIFLCVHLLIGEAAFLLSDEGLNPGSTTN